MTTVSAAPGSSGAIPADLHAPFLTSANALRARDALAADGYLLIEDGYDPGACREIISFIDDYALAGTTEVNYAGTELRIWDAQTRHPLLAAFLQQCDAFLGEVMGEEMRAHTLLAIRNRALDPGDRRSTMGRWHLDSFKRQLKVFLFLTDTSEASGPFEFLPRTQQLPFKLRMLLRGSYIRPGDIVAKGHRTYSSLDDAWVSRLAPQGYAPLPVICKAGTVMVVDSSAIHRARPCRDGSRYALTAYYR